MGEKEGWEDMAEKKAINQGAVADLFEEWRIILIQSGFWPLP